MFLGRRAFVEVARCKTRGATRCSHNRRLTRSISATSDQVYIKRTISPWVSIMTELPYVSGEVMGLEGHTPGDDDVAVLITYKVRKRGGALTSC